MNHRDEGRGRVERYLRQLSWILAVSLLGNACALGVFFYLFTPLPQQKKEALRRISSSLHPLTVDYSLTDVIKLLDMLPRTALLDLLVDKRWVEDGITMRDVALALLIDQHHLDVERALALRGKDIARRSLQLEGVSSPLQLISGLCDGEFEAIRSFCRRERWPLTVWGLLQALQNSRDPEERRSLLEALSLNEPFIAFCSIVRCDGQPLSCEEISQLAVEGPRELFSLFISAAQENTLSSPLRQRLLLAYLEKRSCSAARLLLRLEPHFALKKIDDAHASLMLELLRDSTPTTARYAMELCRSQRSIAVREAASRHLSGFCRRERLSAIANGSE